MTAKKFKFRTQFNSAYKPEDGELNELDSMTRPADHIGLKQLLINHTRGIQSNVQHKEGEYFGDIAIPHFQDITELEDFKLAIKDEQKQLEDFLEEERERIDRERIESESKEESDLSPTPPIGEDTNPPKTPPKKPAKA